MILRAYAQSNLKKLKLAVVGPLLNLRWSSLPEADYCFAIFIKPRCVASDGKVFGIVFFAFKISVSVKLFVMSLFGSCGRCYKDHYVA